MVTHRRSSIVLGLTLAVVCGSACSQADPPAGSGGSGDGATGGSAADGSGTGGSAFGGADAGTGGRSPASGGGPATGGTDGGDCTPTVTCNPEPLPTSGDMHQDCVDRINQFRTGCWCEPPLERWSEGEACADEQAAYDAARDEPHAGFGAGICESGFGQNECPGWDSEQQIVEGCLQMMYDEGPPPTASCSGDCFQAHGHFINMTNPDYGRVACGFFTTASGDVWSVQNFAP